MGKKFLIIPSCSDFNRGDQALVWETERFTKEAGFEGDYYFMAEANEAVEQSVAHGIKPVIPLLEHPSRKFKSRDNVKMHFGLILKWGIVSLADLIWSLILLTPLRDIVAIAFSKEKKNTYSLFKEADAVFVKGGGFIHSYGGVTATYYIYFQLYHIFLSQSLGKEVYIFPNSFGPFEGLGVKAMVNRAFKKSKFVLARECRSAEMCKNELNIDVKPFPDFGFFLPNGNYTNKEAFKKQLNLPCERKLVAITARPHRFPHSQNPAQAYSDFISTMRGFAKWLYKQGFFPVFIEHVYAINNHENDSYCIDEIVRGLEDGTYAYFRNRDINCMDLKLTYSFFDYIVGTRFHSVIFSMANKVPGIAITYVGNKGEGIMEDMAMGDFYIKIADVNTQSLIERFNYLVANREEVVKRINYYLLEANVKRNKLLGIMKA